MKKAVVCLLGVVCMLLPTAVLAQSRAEEVVAALSAQMRALEGYEIGFEVAMGEYRGTGSYFVSGDSYYLVMGDNEVFADGSTRFEVSNSRREIIVGETDAASRSLLDNPVRAFDFLDSEYAPSLLWERDGATAVQLTPTAGSGAPTGNITLVVATASLRPQSIVYDFDGGQVTVRILRFGPFAGPLRTFDRAAYPDYEWIDFR
jgi:outer membrane lipoprotein-sorting protein|nr:hypothetical protein [uncultured Alistipes sp.]